MRRTWTVYAILIGLLAVALVAGWRTHVANRQQAVHHYQDEQLATAAVVAAVLNSELTGASRALLTLAAALAAESESPGGRRSLADHVRCTHQPCFGAVAVYDGRGRVAETVGKAPAFTTEELDDALRWAQDPGNASAVRPVMPSTGLPLVVLITPGKAGGGRGAHSRGLVTGQIEFASLLTGHQRRTAGTASPPPTTLVLDGRGSVVFHSDHPEMRFNNVFKRSARCFACHDSFDDIERLFRTREGGLEYRRRGVPYLGAVAPVSFAGEDWRAMVIAPADRAVGALSSEARQLGMLMAAVVAALAIAGRVTWIAHARRIEVETAAAHRADLERSHTALTAMNAQLESAAVEWRMTVDTIDAAVVVLQPSGVIQRMNRAASDLMSGPHFAWIGRPSQELAGRPPWDAALKLARQAVDRGATATARVRYARTGRTWDLWCRAPQQREGATVVIVVRDVTDVVSLQESLRRSETMAALGSVVVGVAHEVRNPLFAISSMVDAMAVQTQGDRQPFYDALRGAVGRLKTLMNELLEYGTPSTSVLEPHSIRAVIDEAVHACRLEAEARGVGLVTSVSDDTELWMDARRLVRVFINLVQNAVQHAARDTDVTVALSGAAANGSSQVEIVVRDHGPGFPAEDLPRVFTPFFSRRAGGFGLGLAISERIVGEHRGRIVAANHPDGGAVVSVVLPLSAPDGAAQVTEGALLC